MLSNQLQEGESCDLTLKSSANKPVNHSQHVILVQLILGKGAIIVTRCKGVYSRRKKSTEGGLQDLMPPSGQYKCFASRAFDWFFPDFKSQLFCQLLTVLKVWLLFKLLTIQHHFNSITFKPLRKVKKDHSFLWIVLAELTSIIQDYHNQMKYRLNRSV